MTFESIGIIEPILKSLKAKGYVHPTPIQEQSIPIVLEGKDLLGCAQTGTGKTAAFAVPILQQMVTHPSKDTRHRKIRGLVVTPTRELALQIAENFTKYGKHTGLRNVVIFGGVNQRVQTNALRRGVDILVATPGRLLDLMNQGFVSLKDVEYFVLDEADHMLDMGFLPSIRKIIAELPKKRQSLFFSATMPPAIVELAHTILNSPSKVTIQPEQTTSDRVEQVLCFVKKKAKINLLIHLLEKNHLESVLVFSRTKHGADKIVKLLKSACVTAVAIHGNKSQAARQRALGDFKSGKIKVMVATDIAARGIDVSELPLVINYDLPNIPETYVHRIGRTGRALASGAAISFCDVEEGEYLADIQKLIGEEIPVITDHPFHVEWGEELFQKKPKGGGQKPSSQRRRPRKQIKGKGIGRKQRSR